MDECKIVEDLLPLYIEELVSPETGSFVQEHLNGCENCREMHRRMTAPVQPEAQADDFRKSLRKNAAIMVLKSLMLLVLSISLPLYFFWEIGAFGERKIIQSEVSGRKFEVIDNSKAGFFNRSGVYVLTPDGKGRNLRGNESFEDLDVYWSPNGEYYFAWWRFAGEDETYFWGDESVMEPNEEGMVSYSYWDRQWPQTWDFLGLMEAALLSYPDLENRETGEIAFEFDMWSADSERLYFNFTTEKNYRGRIRFDCLTKEFTVAEAYLVQEHELRIPLEQLDSYLENRSDFIE